MHSLPPGEEGGEGDLSRMSKSNGGDYDCAAVEKAEEMTEG